MNPKIKKTLKITGISLGSLLLLFIIAVLILIYLVFTPEKITPIVKKQLKNYITAETNLKSVELTFFSSFPSFGLKIDQLEVKNIVPGAPNSIFVQSESVQLALNIRSLINDNKLEISGITINNGAINAFCDSLGHANYMIMKEDPADTTSEGFDLIRLDYIHFKNCDIRYDDDESEIYFSAIDLNGKLKDMSIDDLAFKTNMNLKSKNIFVGMGVDPYWNHFPLSIEMGFEYLFDSGDMYVHELKAKNNSNQIYVDGKIGNDTIHDGFQFNLLYNVETESVASLIQVIPLFFQSYFEGITLDGYGKIDGKVVGAFHDTSMPLITGHLILKDAHAGYQEMKNVPLTALNTDMDLNIDLNTEEKTFIKINALNFNTLQSEFKADGLIDQVFQDIRFDGNIIATVDLPTISKEFLASTGYDIFGKMDLNIYTKATLVQIGELNLDKIRLKGGMVLHDFKAISEKDTIFMSTPKANVAIELNKSTQGKKRDFLYADISTSNLTGYMGKEANMELSHANIILKTTDFTDSIKSLQVNCNYNIGSFKGYYQGSDASVSSLNGSFSIDEHKQLNRNHYGIVANANQLKTTLMDSAGVSKVVADAIQIDYNITENYGVNNPLLKWIPVGAITIRKGVLDTYLIPETVKLPIFSFKSENDTYEIIDSKILLGKSDFSLVGTLWNLEPYLKNEGILKGDFTFKSDVTDINRIMELTSSDAGSEEVNTTPTPRNEGDPFLVPLNVDLSLKTEIKKAYYNDSEIKNITGGVVVKNGKLILDDLKVDLPGSRVLITAIYRTPRKNHLYIGLDYHMLNVEIEQLLGMFPDIDTIMPMLKSFKGKGEFHFVAESYMFSNYDLKKSTIRGAAAIAGQDLVLLDGETFTEISKTLMFNKKTQNKVDSIAAEFTLYKNEIDVYPFSLKMDKYRAVISGKHNLDMNFIYHISLVESPVPVKLGVDVSGTFDDLKIRLAAPRYAELYRPARQEAIVREQLNLKKLIREALMGTVE